MQDKAAIMNELLENIFQEAKREEFPLDQEVYREAGRDPWIPILFAGNTESPVCFLGRDLGREEVYAGQPLYGAAGRLVRKGIYTAIYGKEAQEQEDMDKAAQQVFLTNTVPYKPLENKAYSTKVKERFRPFLERLLIILWKGNYIIPLGNEALQWFVPYDREKTLARFSKDENRFVQTIPVTLTTVDSENKQWQKVVILAPLPHPSPLNQKYYSLFPKMLAERLQQVQKQLWDFAEKNPITL